MNLNVPSQLHVIFFGLAGFLIANFIASGIVDGKYKNIKLANRMFGLGLLGSPSDGFLIMQALYCVVHVVVAIVIAVNHGMAEPASHLYQGFPWYIGVKMMLVGIVPYVSMWCCVGLYVLTKRSVVISGRWSKRTYMLGRARVILYARTCKFRRLKRKDLGRLIVQKRSSSVAYALLEDEDISAEIENAVMAGRDPEKTL